MLQAASSGSSAAGNGRSTPQPFIQVRDLVKVYKSPAGDFMALKGFDVNVNRGEFVAVIGKSGSGKSTFINMLTGIDRPTSGEVIIGGAPVHTFDENQMAEWRGRNLGIVFQFFQLLPTLTLLENILLPMELNNMYAKNQRRQRAMQLLEMVDMGEHAHKLPAAISGGQQQRVAIARALANDPPLIVADEPTGNLDSKTAQNIFQLFERLVAEGKTILMVTHDDDQAKRVRRTIILSDGQVVNEYLGQALSALSRDQLDMVMGTVEPLTYTPGATIIQQGEVGDKFYIIVKGAAEVLIEPPGGAQMLVNRLSEGQYFGEMALIGDGRRVATVRAAMDSPVSVAALDSDIFNKLLDESPALRQELSHIMEQRQVKNQMQSLSVLPSETLSEFTRDLEVQSYAPGDVIVRQGTLGDTFYLVLDGQVEAVVERADGRKVTMSKLKSGQYFGEMALLGNGRRNATVCACGSGMTRVVELGRDALQRLMTDSAQFQQQVTQLASGRQETIPSTDLTDIVRRGRNQGAGEEGGGNV